VTTQIQCPACGQVYDLTAEQVPQYAGQTITCTRCQKPFTVPAHLTETQPPPAATPPPAPAGHFTYPQSVQSAQFAAPQTKGLAVASLVVGLIGMFCPVVGGLVAVVLGIMALAKTRDPRFGGKGLAIAGICIGAASILFTGCTLSIILPSLSRARHVANRVACQNNMREIGQQIALYANEHGGHYPASLGLLITLDELDADKLVCPETSDTPAPGATPAAQAAALASPGHLSYTYAGAGLTNQSPANTPVLYEPLSNHHDEGTNVLFVDGSVQWLSKPQAQALINRATTRPER
jgi:predicted Zn finger-like uncharacterized protein/prepilin-type processing-associated H-X9-DG protein